LESNFSQGAVRSQSQVKRIVREENGRSTGKAFLTFFATNATSLGNKLDELKGLLVTQNPPDIICVVETWFTDISDTSLKVYVLYRRDRGMRGGGYAFM
jgi:hypothetical protein